MRTIDTFQNQYRESNYEGGENVSYSTELTDLGATTTVTFADGIELPLTVDDVINQSFTMDIFALQFDAAGEPVFGTASVGGADPQAAPEPATFLMVAIGANGLLLRRKPRHR